MSNEIPLSPFIGEYRSQSGFLFREKTINGITRRWCRAVWEEQYQEISEMFFCDNGFSQPVSIKKWIPTRWLDLQEK